MYIVFRFLTVNKVEETNPLLIVVQESLPGFPNTLVCPGLRHPLVWSAVPLARWYSTGCCKPR